MDILTTETLPEGYEVIELGGFFTSRNSIQISQKGLLQSFADRNRNEDQENFDAFVAQARTITCPSGEKANAVIGTRIDTSTAVFSNGVMLITTYYGTAVRVAHKGSS